VKVEEVLPARPRSYLKRAAPGRLPKELLVETGALDASALSFLAWRATKSSKAVWHSGQRISVPSWRCDFDHRHSHPPSSRVYTCVTRAFPIQNPGT